MARCDYGHTRLLWTQSVKSRLISFLLVNLWYGHDAACYGLVSSCLGISKVFGTSNIYADRTEHVDSSHSVEHCQTGVALQLREGKEGRADSRDGHRSWDSNNRHGDCRTVWEHIGKPRHSTQVYNWKSCFLTEGKDAEGEETQKEEDEGDEELSALANGREERVASSGLPDVNELRIHEFGWPSSVAWLASWAGGWCLDSALGASQCGVLSRR